MSDDDAPDDDPEDDAPVIVTLPLARFIAAVEAGTRQVWCTHGELASQCPECGGDALDEMALDEPDHEQPDTHP